MNTSIAEDVQANAAVKQSPNVFLQDVLKGLTAKNKYLESKYFYDGKGDALFQQIMNCPEYYPTKCEAEIITKQAESIAHLFSDSVDAFDVIELGAGDATKSVHLLQQFSKQNNSFTYFPVDISTNVINFLQEKLPETVPGLQVQGLNGEYFAMLEKAKTLSNKTKIVLFLGGNIGNIPFKQAAFFCSSLREHLLPGDFVFIGFDLKKDPRIVLNAYNDQAGYTSCFNLNLLERINAELGGDFKVDQFTHYPTYDPGTGACKSYLVSNAEQAVHVAGLTIHFKKGETIHTEISQKYTVAQTDELAMQSGFKPIQHLFDSKEWFLDSIWQCI